MNKYLLYYVDNADGYEKFLPFKTGCDLHEFILNNDVYIKYIHNFNTLGILKYFSYIFFGFIFELIMKVDFFKWKSINKKHCNSYEMTDAYSLIKVLDSLNIQNQDVILDVGCGKGFPLYIFDKYFKKLVGVELDKELYEICDKNCKKLNIKCSLSNLDISDFEIEEDISHIFLFNPFYGSVMERFLDRIKNRNITIIYHNPVCSSLMKKYGFKLVNKHKDTLGVYMTVWRNY